MLEVRVSFPSVHCNASIKIGSYSGKGDLVALGLPMYSNRLCKRLVYMRFAECLRLSPDVFRESCEIIHCRLKFVTEDFARSRMITKSNS